MRFLGNVSWNFLSKESKKILLTPEWHQARLEFWDYPDTECECDDCLMGDDYDDREDF